MSKTFPWRGGPVAIVLGKDHTIDIRAVRPGDKPEQIFKPDELEDLYATLAAANKPVRNKHFVLMGKPEQPGGRPKAIAPEITQTTRGNGKEREYGYAYVGQQLDDFAPQSFTLRSRPGYTGEPEPIFMAFETAWERRTSETIQRVSNRTVLEPEEPTIPRRKAR